MKARDQQGDEPEFDYSRLWPAVAAIFDEMDTILTQYREVRAEGDPWDDEPVGMLLAPLVALLWRLRVIPFEIFSGVGEDQELKEWDHVPTARELCGFAPTYATPEGGR